MINSILKSYLSVFLGFMTVLLILAFRYKLRTYIYVLSIISIFAGSSLYLYVVHAEKVSAPIFEETIERLVNDGFDKATEVENMEVQKVRDMADGYKCMMLNYHYNDYLTITKHLVIEVHKEG